MPITFTAGRSGEFSIDGVSAELSPRLGDIEQELRLPAYVPVPAVIISVPQFDEIEYVVTRIDPKHLKTVDEIIGMPRTSGSLSAVSAGAGQSIIRVGSRRDGRRK
jgi:hypothetical protein